MPWRIKMYILQQNNGLCMHNILTKTLGEMCDICRCGDIFKSLRTFQKSFRPVGLHFY